MEDFHGNDREGKDTQFEKDSQAQKGLTFFGGQEKNIEVNNFILNLTFGLVLDGILMCQKTAQYAYGISSPGQIGQENVYYV